MIKPHTTKNRNEQGQTMAEFALIMPLLALVLFAILEFGIVFNNYLALTDAVRAGARKAAVSREFPDPVAETRDAVKAAARDLNEELFDEPDRLTVTSTWDAGSDVSVRATYPYSINVLGFVVASGDLESETTERVE